MVKVAKIWWKKYLPIGPWKILEVARDPSLQLFSNKNVNCFLSVWFFHDRPGFLQCIKLFDWHNKWEVVVCIELVGFVKKYSNHCKESRTGFRVDDLLGLAPIGSPRKQKGTSFTLHKRKFGDASTKDSSKFKAIKFTLEKYPL